MVKSNLKPRASTAQFNINSMGEIHDRSLGRPDHAHRHDYYTILLVDKARGEHLIDFNAYRLGEKQVFFVAPGQIHQVIARERPSGWVITFTRDFLAGNNISEHFITNLNLFREYGESPPLQLEDESFDKLQKVVDDMKACLPGELQYRDQALAAFLQIFLIYCDNSCDLDPRQFNEDDAKVCILRDFKNQVENHFQKWHKVQQYAEVMHITPKHLSATIKEISGKTAKEVILERLILEAKRLLRHTDFSIKEIAYQLGFDEPLHFSSFFKRYAGTAPTSFRTLRQ